MQRFGVPFWAFCSPLHRTNFAPDASFREWPCPEAALGPVAVSILEPVVGEQEAGALGGAPPPFFVSVLFPTAPRTPLFQCGLGLQGFLGLLTLGLFADRMYKNIFLDTAVRLKARTIDGVWRNEHCLQR